MGMEKSISKVISSESLEVSQLIKNDFLNFGSVLYHRAGQSSKVNFLLIFMTEIYPTTKYRSKINQTTLYLSSIVKAQKLTYQSIWISSCHIQSGKAQNTLFVSSIEKTSEEGRSRRLKRSMHKVWYILPTKSCPEGQPEENLTFHSLGWKYNIFSYRQFHRE